MTVRRIIPRSEWGARYGDGRYARPLPATEAWLHHSVTLAPDLLPPYTDDYRAMRVIEDIGADRFGEVYGFPYTFAVSPVGLALAGHNIGQTGAHTAGHNTPGIGIVLIGDYQNRRPTEAQLDTTAWLLGECVDQGWLEVARLDGGHRDVKSTDCPGRHAYAAIGEINRRAANPTEEEDDMTPEQEKRLIKKVTASVVAATAPRETTTRNLIRARPTRAELAAAVAGVTAEVRKVGGGDVDEDAIAREILARLGDLAKEAAEAEPNEGTTP